MVKKAVLFIVFVLFSFSLFLTGGVSSKETRYLEISKVENKEIQKKILKYVRDYYKQNKFSGTILVAKDRDILFNRAYGMANYGNNKEYTPNTVFAIASMTKQFTSTAILMLQEKKLLNIKDSLSKYIPDYPNGDKIKIYHLLSNTSGIPDYTNLVDSNQSNITYTPKKIIELFKNKPVDFKPGKSYEYSNSNFILLGYIIEKVSKMKYEDYIQKNILNPLKMGKTGFISNGIKTKDKATGYYSIDTSSNTYKEAPKINGSLEYAAGEIYSNNKDLLRWVTALCDGDVINDESLDIMFTPNLKNYGYGWRIHKNKAGEKLIYHGGNLPGFSSYIQRNTSENEVIIILSNKSYDTAIDDISAGITNILEDN